jgi:hypothetical protein
VWNDYIIGSEYIIFEQPKTKHLFIFLVVDLPKTTHITGGTAWVQQLNFLSQLQAVLRQQIKGD